MKRGVAGWWPALLLAIAPGCVAGTPVGDEPLGRSADVAVSRVYPSVTSASPSAVGELLDTAPFNPSVVSFAANRGDFGEIAAWQAPLSGPLLDPWVSVSFRVESAEGVRLRWRVLQMDACGSERSTSVYRDFPAGMGPVSSARLIVSEWSRGDSLRLSLEASADPAATFEPFVHVTLGSAETYLELAAGAPAVGGREALGFDRTMSGSQELRLTDVKGLIPGDFRWNNQRTIWYNSHAGRWDSILPTSAPPAAEVSAWWLWTDLTGNAQPAKELTARPSSPDAYWDDVACELSVYFSRDASGTSRFHRYLYDPHTDEYVDALAAEGVATDLRGSRRVTIVRSPNGYLWAGVNHDSIVQVARSTDGGATWEESAVIRSTVARGDNHWVLFESADGHRVGLALTEDGGDVLFLHLDQDDPGWRDPQRWIDESSLIPGHIGAERADDELSAVTDGVEVFVVVETELQGVSRADATHLPQLTLYRRDAAGVWSSHVINHYGPVPGDDLKRPTIALNRETSEVYVGVSPLDRSASSVLVASSADLDTWHHRTIFGVEDRNAQSLYNMRLPRHPVDSDIGLPVVVVEQMSGKVWRGWADG